MKTISVPKKLIASVFLIASISACSAADDVVRAGVKAASRSADDAARVADDATRVADDATRVADDATRVADDATRAATGTVNPEAVEKLKAFIKNSGRAKENTKQQAHSYIQAGQTQISRESLWQVAYQTALSELEIYSEKVARAELMEIADAVAHEILYDTESDLQNEYGSQIMFY